MSLAFDWQDVAPRWLLFLLCWPGLALAHISGYTDTSLQVSASGIRILYTVPSDNLLEVGRKPGQEVSEIGPPDAYLATVREGWTVTGNGQRCLLTQSGARALETLPSYQFQLTFVCPDGVDALTIRYGLFFAMWPEHENFARVFLAGQRQRVRFTRDQQALELPVARLLAEWNKPLAVGFFDADPNRGLKDALDGREGGVPKLVEPPPSLGSLDLSAIDPGFVHLGVEHIFAGLDHVLFVVGLVLLTRSWRQLLMLVTSFTVAHTVTLGLSTLGVVSFRPGLTEPLIALTIVYIGIENLWVLRKRAQGSAGSDRQGLIRRVLMVFAFGLVHGVGFSYVLREMGLREEILGSLLFFNGGVELGQLAIICGVLPVLALARHWQQDARLTALASMVVIAVGSGMLVSRF